jgi:non-homologous end joining protein Ku
MIELDASEVGREVNTDAIDLTANLRSSEVPAEWVDKSYLIWPKDAASADAFALLVAYCRDNDRALVGTTTEKGTTKSYVIRYSDTGGTLVAQLLRYEENVRWAHVEQITAYMAEVGEPDAAASQMAATLFDSLPDSFDWSSVTDTYGEALSAAIAAKASGQAPAAKPAAQAPPSTDTLMEALKASVAAAGSDATREKVTA